MCEFLLIELKENELGVLEEQLHGSLRAITAEKIKRHVEEATKAAVQATQQCHVCMDRNNDCRSRISLLLFVWCI